MRRIQFMKKLVSCLFIVLLIIGCKSLDSHLDTQVVPQTSFFTQEINLAIPVENRMQNASVNVISWLNSIDSADNYNSYLLTEEEKSLFIDYLQLLPEKYKQTMGEKVIAIFFIENFKGGGMTFSAFDKDGNIYIILFFNPEILHRPISDWINYRDNSYFNEDTQDIKITAECSGNYFALLHTLIHEASHVYDCYYHITPFMEPCLKNKNSAANTDFTKMVWRDYNSPITEYDFPYRNELYSYGLGPAQSNYLAFDIYKSLANTPFPTLYGSKNWAEDFAESFTWFYLGEKLNCHYRVSINETFVYEPFLNKLFTDRFSRFKEIMEN